MKSLTAVENGPGSPKSVAAARRMPLLQPAGWFLFYGLDKSPPSTIALTASHRARGP
jgi:hypothetical protein